MEGLGLASNAIGPGIGDIEGYKGEGRELPGKDIRLGQIEARQ